ncbi:MAG TPA: hypothetical protein VLG27_03045, partial [Candidatus Saccharimonadia bacterium]|nr:hypothetical protein [Candidatus Saccharimonadia bacterium]
MAGKKQIFLNRKSLTISALISVLFLAFFAMLGIGQPTANAANPTTMNFQGKVTNANGTNVTDGSYTFIFRLYQNVNVNTYNPNTLSCSADTNCWWEETDTVSVTSGVFQVNLGATCAFTSACNSGHSGIDFNSQNALSLTMKFNGDANGYMTPLMSMQSVPYALNSDKVGGLSASQLARVDANNTLTGTNTFQPTTNITAVKVLQNSSGSFGQDVFDVQGSGGSSNFIQVTSTAANQGAVTVQSLGNNALNLNSGSNTISIGATSLTATGALTVSAGSTNTSLDLEAGTVGSVSLGTSANNKTVNVGSVGSTANTTTLNLANSTGAAQTVNIGSTNTTGSTTIKGGTGSGSGGIIINPNGSSNSGVVVVPSSDSTAAFQVQNASSSSLLNIDTSGSNIALNGNVTISGAGTTLFSDGFESGTMAAWTNTGMTVQTTTVHSGSDAALSTYTTGSAKFATANLTSTSTSLYFRAYVYLTSNTNSSGTDLIQANAGANTFTVFISNGGSGNLVCLFNSVTAGSTCGTATMSTGAWHELELRLNNGASGNWQLSMDGSSVTSATGIGMGASNFNQIQIGEGNAGKTNSTNYFDDVLATSNVASFTVNGPSTLGGTLLGKPVSDSATAFQFQTSGGNNVLTVDTTNNQIILGKASTAPGTIQFASSGGANTVTLQGPTTNPGSSYTLKLPTTAPSLSQCLQNDGTTIGQLTFGSCAGATTSLQNAYTNGTTITLTQNTPVSIKDSSTASTTNLFQVQNNGATITYFGVSTAGETLTGLQPASVVGAGTNAGSVLTVTGVAGGATSGTATTAGIGSTVSISAGAGGNATDSTNNTATAGAGGGLTFTAGAGGTNSSTGARNGAIGGGITLVGGQGGNATGAGTSGTGGSITLQAGAAGTGGTTAGIAGGVLVKGLGNATTAFQIQNASSGNLLQVDTTNSVVTVDGNNSGDTATWQTGTSLFNGLSNPGAVAANGYIYLVGGANSSGKTNTVMIGKLNADGSINSWRCQGTTAAASCNTSAGNIPNANVTGSSVSGNGSIVVNGFIYSIGGYNGGSQIPNVYMAKLSADGTTGAWTSTTSLPDPNGRAGFGIVAVNGYIYIVAGDSTGGLQSTVYYARPNADGTISSWSTTTSALPVTDHGQATVADNGYIYVFAGKPGGVVSSGSTVYRARV